MIHGFMFYKKVTLGQNILRTTFESTLQAYGIPFPGKKHYPCLIKNLKNSQLLYSYDTNSIFPNHPSIVVCRTS